MRVNSGRSGGIGAVRSKGDAAPSVHHSSAAEGKSAVDDVVVSPAAHIAQLKAAALEKINEIPSVRATLVAAIQSQFNSDSYRPDPEAVVDGLLKEHLQPSLG